MNLTPSQLARLKSLRARTKPRRQWPMMLLALLAVIVIGMVVGLILMMAYCEAPADGTLSVAALGLGALVARGTTP